MIQYSATTQDRDGGDYWIPAFAGMTTEIELDAGYTAKGEHIDDDHRHHHRYRHQ